ncbi:unnamed protein product [Rangifer tarandus platyrhynchus]|uniref:Uncharacterized protein n=1 Tax=Rangifer tarandus platyrhynchus TaxID=3082113 RepID=A0AC59Z710_RANTA
MFAVALHPPQVRLALSVDQLCTGSLGGKAATSEDEAARVRPGAGARAVPGSPQVPGAWAAGRRACVLKAGWWVGSRSRRRCSGPELECWRGSPTCAFGL